jgi:hypothetical protein
MRRSAPRDNEEDLMRYMLTIIAEEGGWEDVTPADMKAQLERWNALTEELKDSGAFIAGEGLQESATATTVRVGEGGERLVTDGPFAETNEQVGGFYLLECNDLDEALEWAKKLPISRGGVEVRPVMDYEQYGSEDSTATAEASA